MHELSLCRSIGGVVTRSAAGRDVAVVHVRVGALRQVVASTLVYCWELTRHGTDLEGSVLAVEEVPAVIECRFCGASTPLALPVFVCAGCGGSEVALVSGEEFLVTSLELTEPANG